MHKRLLQTVWLPLLSPRIWKFQRARLQWVTIKVVASWIWPFHSRRSFCESLIDAADRFMCILMESP